MCGGVSYKKKQLVRACAATLSENVQVKSQVGNEEVGCRGGKGALPPTEQPTEADQSEAGRYCPTSSSPLMGATITKVPMGEPMRSLHKTHPKQSALTTVSRLYVVQSQSSIQVPKSPLLPLKVVLSEKKT